MVKINKKYGFSLAEVLVVLIIISVFFAATAKVMTKKRPNEKVSNQHGQFECYKNNSHTQQYYIENIPKGITNGTSCTFKPNINAAIYHVYVYLGNTGYILETTSNITQELTITLDNSKVEIKNEDNVKSTYPFSDSRNGTKNEFESFLESGYGHVNLKNNLSKPAVFIIW